jgi:hypothetical protein
MSKLRERARVVIDCIDFSQPTSAFNRLENKIVAALEEERERCARIAANGCLVPPDGGSPTEAERQMCDGIAAAIRNEKS